MPIGVIATTGVAATVLLAQASAAPQVIGADGILCDLTRTIAGPAARVSCLVEAGQDPHGLQLRPSQRADLAAARLVLINGFNLTPALKGINTQSPVIAVGEEVLAVNPSQDPHLWHDPMQVVAMAGVVASKLESATDSSANAGIAQREQNAVAVLKDLDRWAAAQISTVPPQQRVLVSKHRAFGFLAKRYGIKELPVMDSFATGGALRPSSLRKITQAIQSSGTRAIFSESLPPSKALRRISRSAGIPIAPQPLVADGLAPGQNLVATATGNICTFVNAQGGQCDTTQAKTLSERWAALP